MTSTENKFCIRRLILPTLVVVGFAVCVRPFVFSNQQQRLSRRASQLYYHEDFAGALAAAKDLLESDPENRHALLIAGSAAAELFKSDEAISWFNKVPQDNSPESMRAFAGIGKRLLMLHRVSEAEPYLRAALALNPRHFEANKNLSTLLQIQGRTWESLPCIREQIRHGQFRGDELQMLSVSEILFVDDKRFINECLHAVPDDPLPLLAKARYDHMRDNPVQSEELLRRIVAAAPHVIEAHARIGQILLDSSRVEEFVEWNQQLPAGADDHPEIWFARGMWAVNQRQIDSAARCFLEVVTRSPNHVKGNYQLSLLFGRLGEGELAKRFSERADLLSKLELEYIGLINTQRTDGMRKTAGLLEDLGRYAEAAGMYELCIRLLAQPPEWATAGIKRSCQLIDSKEDMIIAAANPLRDIQISEFPLPRIRYKNELKNSASAATPGPASVTFSDLAEETGLDFNYFNGTETSQGLNHIFETTGGGIASLDYDADLWPDLYFTQGSVLPPRTDNFDHLDSLYRNRQGQRFADVTQVAGLGDHLFGQGVAAGDFNNDGFQDLYVGNIGKNRLYQNNGDGTFTDVTESAGVGGDAWTLSCMIADLNNDAWPEIYAVNYLTIQSVLDRTCRKNGHPQTCAPTLFPAEQDQLHRNTGDGRFKDVTEKSGLVQPNGKGLGIIAADFDGSGRLNVFVGNDTAANFYFVNKTEHGAEISFTESALLTGLAVDANGRAQASMGIAADDADSDGLIDLFITNFYADPNTMYLQQPGQHFVDETRRAGLHSPSFNQLGFGTQFLDGELDGYPDLILTNGHVDRTEATQEPDEMPPQYFQNLGGGQFREIESSRLGRFFEGKYLGRSLTRLDWNRDGCEDVCIGHLHSPTALVTNTTQTPGNYLSIRIRGITSSRDAIGTRISVTADGRKQIKQLIAGDGYLSSNQRLLVFGLRNADIVSKLTIEWPSGIAANFADVPVNAEIMVLENEYKRFYRID